MELHYCKMHNNPHIIGFCLFLLVDTVNPFPYGLCVITYVHKPLIHSAMETWSNPHLPSRSVWVTSSQPRGRYSLVTPTHKEASLSCPSPSFWADIIFLHLLLWKWTRVHEMRRVIGCQEMCGSFCILQLCISICQ